jgi:hypothetical protein
MLMSGNSPVIARGESPDAISERKIPNPRRQSPGPEGKPQSLNNVKLQSSNAKQSSKFKLQKETVLAFGLWI